MARQKTEVWELPIGQVQFKWEGDQQILLIDGYASSAINWAHPRRPVFSYLQWADAVAETWIEDTAESGNIASQARFSALHLGTAAGSLPLAWALRYPKSQQNAVEICPELVELVRKEVDFPKAARFKIRVADALEVVTQTRPGRWSIIVQDVFANGIVPPAFQTPKYLQKVATALTDNGLFMANTTVGLQDQLDRYRRIFSQVKAIRGVGLVGRNQQSNTLLVATTESQDSTFWERVNTRLLRCSDPARLEK